MFSLKSRKSGEIGENWKLAFSLEDEKRDTVMSWTGGKRDGGRAVCAVGEETHSVINVLSFVLLGIAETTDKDTVLSLLKDASERKQKGEQVRIKLSIDSGKGK